MILLLHFGQGVVANGGRSEGMKTLAWHEGQATITNGRLAVDWDSTSVTA